MYIILLDKVEHLGNLGDQVKVKSGYARNFLVPQGKAVPATKKNVEYLRAYRDKLEDRLTRVLENARFRAEKVNTLGFISISSKSGAGGKLFGSIGTRVIASAVSEKAGILVDKKEVRLKNGVLRNLGEHEVRFQFHSEVFAEIIVNVVSEQIV